MTIHEKVSLSNQVHADEVTRALAELCSACHLDAMKVIEWVDEGILDAQGHKLDSVAAEEVGLLRVRRARRLFRDLGAGNQEMSSVLDLMEEVQLLRSQTRGH